MAAGIEISALEDSWDRVRGDSMPLEVKVTRGNPPDRRQDKLCNQTEREFLERQQKDGREMKGWGTRQSVQEVMQD